MRQLDLFGSLTDPLLPEKKQGEKLPVLQNDEKVNNVIKAGINGDDDIIEEASAADENGRIDSMSENAVLPGSSDYPAIFDATVIIADKVELVRNEQRFNIVAAEKITEESSVQNFNSNQVLSKVATEDEAAVTVEEELRKPPLAITADDILIQKVGGKQQKERAEEGLKRGVIFDNGKIAVKIKNKTSAEPELMREKQEVHKIHQKRGRKSFREMEAEVDLIDIPEDEVLFQKQYYSISEVAKWFRVNTSLLRFWENEFDILKPKKNRKGDRLFRPEDVKSLQLIYQLLRERKYTIEGAKEYLKTNRKKADIEFQLTTTLQRFKSFLLDLKANLQ